MNGHVWINGTYLPAREATVSLFDPGFLFGEGIFTTLCVRDGRIECLQQHLKRLSTHSKELQLPHPTLQEEDLRGLLQRNEAQQGWWRLKLGRPPLVEFAYLQAYTLLTQPGHLGVYPWPIQGPHSHLKTLAYLDRMHIQRWAQQHRFDDAITQSAEGFLLESAFSNVFWIPDQTLYTPCASLALLPRIALQGVQAITQSWGWAQRSGRYRLDDISSNAQLFTCNALTGPRAVAKLSSQAYTVDTELSRCLQHSYRNWAVSIEPMRPI